MAQIWHLRVHRIKSGRKLTSDSRSTDREAMKGRLNRALERQLERSEGAEGRAASRAGVSGIADLGTGRTGQVLRVDANSDLIEARAVLLTLMAECDKGEEQGVWYVSGVFAIPSSGDLGASKGWMKEWERRPTVPEEISTSPI